MQMLTCFLFSLLISTAYGQVDLETLHQQLKNNHTSPLEYPESKKYLFQKVDNIKGEVCSAYTPLECKHYQQKRGGFNLNVEHTWPQSKGAKYFPAQGDLHHLYVTSKESNSKRANRPFCIVYESTWEKQGSYQGINTDMDECFEPQDNHKGNVARAMFYFSVRYKKNLDAKQEKLFRAWNLLDPVNAQERVRNHKIQKLQGNRNPFIDNESLIDHIDSFTY
jgi:hypothetical protein